MEINLKTKELTNVCVTNASNLIEIIKNQIIERVENHINIGVIGSNSSFIGEPYLEDVAFKYYNPQIINNQLYIDLKILDTPRGQIMAEVLNLVAKENTKNLYQFIAEGCFCVMEDNKKEYHLYSINFTSM